MLRPYDAYLVLKGDFYALEYKMHKVPRGFPFNRVSDKQVERLQSAKRAGGQGLLLINCRYQLSEKQMPKDGDGNLLFNGTRLNYVIVLDVDEFVEFKDASAMKSLDLEVQLEQFMNNGIMEREGKYWDIKKIIDCFGDN